VCPPHSQAEADTAALAALIDEHDVVFLLMDTRESRSAASAPQNQLLLSQLSS
jgi:hypothetical protein